MSKYKSKWSFLFLSAIAGCVMVLGVSCNQMCGKKEVKDRIMKEAEKTNPFVHAAGTRIVDGNGAPLTLKGCNLGNWLLLEMWMMDVKGIHDQHEYEEILATRFGEAKKDELMELFRANWITERDFEIIRSFGFNVIRLPFYYTLLEDEPFTLKPDAFKWLDQCLAWGEKYGIYVILDMHGVPGGQSVDHTTGRAGQNKLYADQSCRDRAAWLWLQIAERYKDSTIVAAYDFINEPFGDYKTEDHQQGLIEVMDQIYKEVRSVDPHHMVMIPGTFAGIKFYGDPKALGWENVCFQEHYYPGLHGWGEPTYETHKKFINRQLVSLDAYMKEMDTPFLLGEFNVVFRQAGGPSLMRYYYDYLAERNWAGTMWSYKIVYKKGGLGQDNWYMVKNLNDAPFADTRTASLEEIETYYRWLGTMEYAVDTDLQDALTATHPEQLAIFEPYPPIAPPFVDALTGWQATDISNALTGGQRVDSASQMAIYGGGADIYKDTDQFRFVSQPVDGDFELEATVTALEEAHTFAKAGLMIRGGLAPDDALVLVNVFPDSQVTVACREEKGAMISETKQVIREFPIRLKLARNGGVIRAYFAFGDEDWQEAGRYEIPALNGPVQAGMAVLSHDNRFLAKAEFKDIQLRKGAE
ncbi:MAG: hypothetical protein EOM20_12960 [Spartobacteria bacterium]|nr:hypothetical protein [Spartobacteria bacterium]